MSCCRGLAGIGARCRLSADPCSSGVPRFLKPVAAVGAYAPSLRAQPLPDPTLRLSPTTTRGVNSQPAPQGQFSTGLDRQTPTHYARDTAVPTEARSEPAWHAREDSTRRLKRPGAMISYERVRGLRVVGSVRRPSWSPRSGPRRARWSGSSTPSSTRRGGRVGFDGELRERTRDERSVRSVRVGGRRIPRLGRFAAKEDAGSLVAVEQPRPRQYR